jgi:hypothetical protein
MAQAGADGRTLTMTDDDGSGAATVGEMKLLSATSEASTIIRYTCRKGPLMIESKTSL